MAEVAVVVAAKPRKIISAKVTNSLQYSYNVATLDYRMTLYFQKSIICVLLLTCMSVRAGRV